MTSNYHTLVLLCNSQYSQTLKMKVPRPLIFCFFLLSALLLLLLLLVAPTSSSSEKVTVSLYYEALCPYCADFIVNHLVKIFQTGLISSVDLRMVPWGNAWVRTDGTVVCQHGDDECFLNTIEACTIALYPDVAQHFRFIDCIEQLTLQSRHNKWSNCFQIAGLGKEPVDCYSNGNGDSIEKKFAMETDKLNAPHRFVPWVVVNNQPLQEDYMNFVDYICRAFNENAKPGACTSVSAKRTYDFSVGTAAFASQKVDLSVYYESLCHSCATFIIKNLGEIFNNGLFNIINLQLLPWANSHIGNASNSIICQNGSDEWQLNSLQTCVLNVWDDVNKHYALISCLEFLAIEGRQKSWKICFKQLGLPEKPILDCYNNGNGTELGRKYISKTAQLYPPHDFLPWVLVNNQPIGKDYANFRTYVCRAYKGTAAPAACNSPWEKENGGFLNTRSLA